MICAIIAFTMFMQARRGSYVFWSYIHSAAFFLACAGFEFFIELMILI